jgi:hypothetical protein
MGFFTFLVTLGIAYLVWRVTDQLPDLIFRLSEIQRDVAEIRRQIGTTEPVGITVETAADAAPAADTAPAAESSATE